MSFDIEQGSARFRLTDAVLEFGEAPDSLPDQFQYFLVTRIASKGIEGGVVLDPSTP
jgi:hypothetical protein